MKQLFYMIIVCRQASRFAGKVVAYMISRGCDPQTLRKYEIPQSVYYGVLGSHAFAHRTPEQYAEECLGYYRREMMFAMEVCA